MKTLILITEQSVTFDLLIEIFGKKFQCSQVLDNRLTIESASDHIFIDFDDSIKDDYDESEIKNSDCHFFAVLYNSEDFVRKALKELSTYQIRVDNDYGIIIPIETYLKEHDYVQEVIDMATKNQDKLSIDYKFAEWFLGSGCGEQECCGKTEYEKLRIAFEAGIKVGKNEVH